VPQVQMTGDVRVMDTAVLKAKLIMLLLKALVLSQ